MTDHERSEPPLDVRTQIILEFAQNFLYAESLRVSRENFLRKAANLGRSVGQGLFEGCMGFGGIPYIDYPREDPES